MFHKPIGSLGPGKFCTPNTQADEDKEPAGAGGYEHNEACNKAEGTHSDDEGLIEVAHHRMCVHAFLAGFEPAVETTGFAFFDFVCEGFQGVPSSESGMLGLAASVSVRAARSGMGLE